MPDTTDVNTWRQYRRVRPYSFWYNEVGAVDVLDWDTFMGRIL